MSRLKFEISMSLDGFVAGPEPGPEQPLGAGGEQLHEWATKLKVWRESHGYEGGEENVDSQVLEESIGSAGATIMGRGMFGGGPGPWGEDPWQGWWGDEPPFGTPVYVLTHHARDPLELGGTTFIFVTDGIESALEQASDAAGERPVALGGGAQVAQQYLDAGLVDEMRLHLVPVLLGGGVRLLENVDPKRVSFELAKVVESPAVTHITYRVTS